MTGKSSWCIDCIANNNKISERKRINKYLTRYGITIEDFDRMLLEQNGVCAICNKTETKRHNKSGKVTRLCIDHCHKTGKVRALLCDDCNVGIARMQENTKTLENAITYLLKYKCDEN